MPMAAGPELFAQTLPRIDGITLECAVLSVPGTGPLVSTVSLSPMCARTGSIEWGRGPGCCNRQHSSEEPRQRYGCPVISSDHWPSPLVYGRAQDRIWPLSVK